MDFCRDRGLLDYFGVIADRGTSFTTPREPRNRADVLLLVGPAAGRSETVAQIMSGKPVLSAGEGGVRDVLWLCEGGAGNALSSDDVMKLGGDLAAIHGILGVLNTALKGRPIPADGFGGLTQAAYEEIAGRLMTARFGVIAWSSEDLDALAMQSLLDAADHLNQSTRVTTLPLGGPAPAQTAALVSSWTTGFPARTGFARGFPEYDPWRFDAARLVTSGECDALVWVSSFEAAAPGWKADVPTIALTAPGTVFARAPEVFFRTAIPGTGADAELYSQSMQTLVHARATEPSDLPTPAAVLEGILDRLEAAAA
jgi:formylmethanofuran dehydrogenase subunit B